MAKAKAARTILVERGSADVLADLGFSAAEAEEIKAKGSLIGAINDTIRRRKLTQIATAQICGTDQPTLSKVLRGRVESVTIDRLMSWLRALGEPSRSAFGLTAPRPRQDRS
jgi:predicted XRE-type DNA-binding protein